MSRLKVDYINHLRHKHMDYPFLRNVAAHLYSRINAGESSAFGMRVISINNRSAHWVQMVFNLQWLSNYLTYSSKLSLRTFSSSRKRNGREYERNKDTRWVAKGCKRYRPH